MRVGSTSVAINLEVWVKPAMDHPDSPVVEFQVTSATFTYVAVDSEGRKKTIQRGCRC